MRISRSVLCVLVAALACRQPSTTLGPRISENSAAVTAVADRVVAHVRSLGTIPRPDDTTLSDATLATWNDSVDVWLRALREIDTTGFATSPSWVIYGVMREGLEANAGLRICRRPTPDRDACYAAGVRVVTTLPLDAGDLRRMGAEEQAVLDRELAPFAERLLGAVDPAETRRRLRSDARFMAPTREAILAVADTATQRARSRLGDWFIDPPSDTLVIKRETPENEPTSPGGRYLAPTPSDPVAGLVINTYKPESRALADIVNAAVHEGYPGHHFQFAVAQRAPAKHLVLSVFRPTGFIEGWAFYTERLADEMGVYTDDAQRAFYRVHLSDGAVALRVDAGLLTGRWTRDQAIDTMMIVSGRPRWLAEAYADRHLGTRSQIVSYMVGYRTFMDLREEARRRLGARFDIKRFHAVVLNDGPVTLPMLRQKVEHWIATGGGPPAASH